MKKPTLQRPAAARTNPSTAPFRFLHFCVAQVGRTRSDKYARRRLWAYQQMAELVVAVRGQASENRAGAASPRWFRTWAIGFLGSGGGVGGGGGGGWWWWWWRCVCVCAAKRGRDTLSAVLEKGPAYDRCTKGFECFDSNATAECRQPVSKTKTTDDET